MKSIVRMVSAALALVATQAIAQTQGVSKTEIVLGSIQDLSGPVAGPSKQARQGMMLRVSELNEQGGVHGRKIRLIVEDSGYDPKRAVLAAQKLVAQEKIFVLAGHFGTPQNIAAMPILFDSNVINFYPLAASRDLYEPLNKLKTAFLPNIYDQMRIASVRLIKDHNLKRPCILYQDDEYGQEILRGAEAGLKTINASLVEKTSYKRGATDFSSQVTRMKGANCDLVMLGTVVRETVGAMVESKKMGFNPVFVATVGGYNAAIPRLGGKEVDGLYATHTAQLPYMDDPSQPIRFWAQKYRTAFNEDPTDFAAYGYHIIDAFIRVAEKAGPNLTVDTFLKALDGITIPRDIFGIAEASFTATKRLGNPYPRLSQLKDGRWGVVSDYADFNGLPATAPKK